MTHDSEVIYNFVLRFSHLQHPHSITTMISITMMLMELSDVSWLLKAPAACRISEGWEVNERKTDTDAVDKDDDRGGDDIQRCLLVGCLMSLTHASVSQGRICSNHCTRCHTETEVADPTFYLTQSRYTDTGPTSPSTDPLSPGTWQGSHSSANS